MKLAQTPWLFSSVSGYLYRSRPGPHSVCRMGILEVFDLPMYVPRVRFVAYDRPAKDRIRVTYAGYLFGRYCTPQGYDRSTPSSLDGFVRRAFLKSGGKPVYVELEYYDAE